MADANRTSQMKSPSGTAWKPIVKRSMKVSLVVGTVLNAINQPAFLFGEAELNLFKAALTYCVPFAVSMYGAYTALRSIE